MTEDAASKPFYENEEEYQQDIQNAVDKLDKEIGWTYEKVPLKENYPPRRDTTSNDNWSYHELERRYEHLKRVTLQNLPKVWPGLEFSLSVKSTLNIRDNTLPFPGIILGPASGSKTLIVEMYKGYKHVLYLDSFSPRSFVSHNSSMTKEKLKEVDLLPKLKNKFFLVSELSTIFSAKDEDLLQIMGVLTRVVDGQGYQNHTGAQGLRGYDENIMFSWIGASVEISPKVFKVLSTLGPKLYFFRLPREEQDEEYYFKKKNEKFNEKKQAVKVTLHEYLSYFDMNPEAEFDTDNELPKIKLQEELDEDLSYRIIIRVSRLLARLRAIVPTRETRDSQGSEYNFGLAKIEDPERAITQLTFLARGHALSQGRKYINVKDIPLVIHTAFSTTTIEKVRIFELLIANGGKITTSQICLSLNTTHPTARKTMTELMAVGLVTMQKEEENHEFTIKLKPEYDWFLTNEFKKLKASIFSEHEQEVPRKEETVPDNNIIIPTIGYSSQIARQVQALRGGDFSFNGSNTTGEEFPPKCYHCNVNGFTTKDQYEKHVVYYHKNMPCYPGPADLEKLGLEPQRMSWERQLPRDQYFEFELGSKK